MGNMDSEENKDTFPGASIFSRFKSAGIRQGWWSGKGPIVAALSGGSDSMAMLWLLRFFWKGSMIAAHLEHGFRKETAIRDAGFVENICREWGISCKVEHRNVPSLKRSGESLEEAGRRERYQFLRKVAKENGALFIATGHTADDSAETIFFNIIRGTGIRGLRGIPEIRNEVIRPIIECYRDELQSFLSARKIPWVTDESNEEVKYFRNRIRHVIFPFLEHEGGPRLKEHLLSLGTNACEVEKYRENLAVSMSSWCTVHFPLAEKAWRLNILRMMDDLSLQSLFARAGRDLGLSSLSRGKTASLLGLINKGFTPWRFQWENAIEICGSKKMAAIINRSCFYDGSDRETILTLEGESGTFSWGYWDFEWSRKDGISSWSGDLASLVPFPVQGFLRVSSLASYMSKSGDLNRIPWWCLKKWPVVHAGNLRWIPLEGFLPEDGYHDKSGRYIRIRAFVTERIMKGAPRNEL
ncbi:MAG: tRNA lysidine(34) synthetase TilS [Thermovirga sp.]